MNPSVHVCTGTQMCVRAYTHTNEIKPAPLNARNLTGVKKAKRTRPLKVIDKKILLPINTANLLRHI